MGRREDAGGGGRGTPRARGGRAAVLPREGGPSSPPPGCRGGVSGGGGRSPEPPAAAGTGSPSGGAWGPQAVGEDPARCSPGPSAARASTALAGTPLPSENHSGGTSRPSAPRSYRPPRFSAALAPSRLTTNNGFYSVLRAQPCPGALGLTPKRRGALGARGPASGSVLQKPGPLAARGGTPAPSRVAPGPPRASLCPQLRPLALRSRAPSLPSRSTPGAKPGSRLSPSGLRHWRERPVRPAAPKPVRAARATLTFPVRFPAPRHLVIT